MRKIVETRSLLSNTIKDTSTIMCNPSLYIFRQRVTPETRQATLKALES